MPGTDEKVATVDLRHALAFVHAIGSEYAMRVALAVFRITSKRTLAICLIGARKATLP